MPNAESDKYRTCTINDRSKTGKSSFTWEADASPDKISGENDTEWSPVK
jgi:hypothetical protein